MRKFSIALLPHVLLLVMGGCATLKGVARTLDDAADIACNIFGAEHPEEFKQLALSVLPPGAAEDAEAEGFSPAVLCDIKEIIQPFIDDQIRMQASTAASLRAE